MKHTESFGYKDQWIMFRENTAVNSSNPAKRICTLRAHNADIFSVRAGGNIRGYFVSFNLQNSTVLIDGSCTLLCSTTQYCIDWWVVYTSVQCNTVLYWLKDCVHFYAVQSTVLIDGLCTLLCSTTQYCIDWWVVYSSVQYNTTVLIDGLCTVLCSTTQYCID
jgi:hypothetical protein